MAEARNDTVMNTEDRNDESPDKEDSSDEDVNFFSCSVCSATFVTEISLSRHMFVHEENEEDQAHGDTEDIDEEDLNNEKGQVRGDTQGIYEENLNMEEDQFSGEGDTEGQGISEGELDNGEEQVSGDIQGIYEEKLNTEENQINGDTQGIYEEKLNMEEDQFSGEGDTEGQGISKGELDNGIHEEELNVEESQANRHTQGTYEEERSSHTIDRHRMNFDTEEASTSTASKVPFPTMLEAILKRKPTMDINSSASESPLHPAKMPKLQINSRPIPNLKPLPPLIPKQEFEMAQQLRSFVCDTCGVSFNKKEDLSRHVTRTHGGARFTCPYCQRNISRRDHLKRHIKNVHPEYCTDTEIGPFLADPNASRAAKEQHAENFVAHFPMPAHCAMPDVHGDSLLSLYEQLQIPQHTNTHSILQTQLMGQHDQKYNDDLEEEGDDEFEGEEEPEGGTQQITVEPELPPPDYDEEGHDEKYEDPDPLQFMELKRKLAQRNIAVSNEGNSMIAYGLDTMSILNQRKQIHVIERKFKCDTCGAAFMSKINLQRHESTHSIVRPHKCTLCGKGFLRKEHLTKHLSSVHSGMKFTCQFCNKDISRKDHLLRHIRNCHPAEFMGMPPELLVQQQQISQIKFESPHANSNSWENNIQNQPSEKQTLLACDICFETFYHIDELNEHQSSVHTDVWKFKCPHCTKAFKRKEHLTKHQVLHTNEKKFGCSICRKVFPRKDAVYEHIRSVHGNTQNNSNTFPCNLCDKVFKQKSFVNQHLKMYHGVIHNSDENGIYSTPQNTMRKPIQPPKTNISRLHSLGLGIDVTTSRQIDENIGSLMGLINKGSLSVSTVNSSGQ